jgi:hypothetical protein
MDRSTGCNLETNMRRFVPILSLTALALLAACNAPAPESKPPTSAEPAPPAVAEPASTPVAAAERQEGRGQRGPRGPQTLEAFQARVAGGFEGLDANRDGVVSTEELNGASGGRASPMMKRLDANNDGQVTRAEMSAGAARMFARMDANGDGVVTPEERPQFGPGGPREGSRP